jgi:hypothetical protein
MIGRTVGWLTPSLVLLAVTTGSPASAAAQGATAAIQGTIADATGPLPGATITARDVQSGFATRTTCSMSASSVRTRAADRRFRRPPCRSSRC